MNRRKLCGWLAIVSMASNLTCSPPPATPPTTSMMTSLGYTAPTTAPAGLPASNKTVSSAAPTGTFGTAVIKGHVTFTGVRPPARTISMTGDQVCAACAAPPDPSREIAADGSLPNVFVYIKSGLSGSYSVPQTSVLLDQTGCMYSPHVFGIQVNQSLNVRNSDPTVHNIHSLPNANTTFNFVQPTRGMIRSITFNRPEVMVKLKCDVHGWMSAYAGVVTHPFFGVTDAKGLYQIDKLPAGTYEIEIWHELFQRQKKTVTVSDGQTLTLDFVYSGNQNP